jgi:hypothetical protein
MSLLTAIEALLEDDSDAFLYNKDWTILENEIIDQTRWAIVNRAVITDGNDYVAVEYCTGATEYQDDTELDGTAYEVSPQQVVVTKYVRA